MICVQKCLEVFAMRLNGASYETICYEKKLSHKTVYNILHGQSKNAKLAVEILKIQVEK